MTQATNEFGELGERIAARWFQRSGWRVVARRFRAGRRDIDLIIEREGLIAFVEVKSRTGVEFGDPVEAVHRRKQRSLTKSAQSWIARHGRSDEKYRFDVVGVLVSGERVFVKHVPGAFEAA
jgi:putative endonuclease